MDTPAPSQARKTLIVWLAIFPLVTIVLSLMPEPLLAMPMVVRSFVLTVIVVPVAVNLIVPWLTRTLPTSLRR